MDNVLSYKSYDVLKDTFNDPNLRQKVKLLCVFGCGGEEVIFVTDDDRVYGFGRNRFGGLGLGTLEEHIRSPRLNPTLSGKDVINIVCGFEHWIALTDTGLCFGWGHNESGQLGVGTVEETQTPLLIECLAEHFVVDVACGGFFTLALTVEGKVYAWGHNQFGQLGDSTYANRTLPVMTQIDFEIKSISCGIKHAMAVTTTEKTYVWGLNSFGQLGCDRSRHYINKPELISGFEAIAVSKAVCGPNHSLILTKEGLVFAFGENSGGQIGTGRTEPQVIPFCVKPDVKFADIIAHKENDISIAVSLDEKFYVWGLAKNRRYLVPQMVVSTDSVYDVYAQFTKKSVTFKTIVFDQVFNNWELKDPNRKHLARDSDQVVDGIESFSEDNEVPNEWTKIERKSCHKSSVLSTICPNDGKRSNTSNDSIKELVDFTLFPIEKSLFANYLNDIRLLCVLGRGNSVIFITKGNSCVYGFGHNRNGYLGLGHCNEDIRKPELNRFLSNHEIIDIVWGFEHCIGLTASGQCISWGQNRYGQLGLGSYEASPTPVLIKEFADKTVVQVCSGSYHSMALTSDGEVFSWGHNTFAQLGDRTYNSRESPTQILINDPIDSITCGLNHSMALTTSGQVYVWGVNEMGQLGRCREQDIRVNRDKPMCNRPQRLPYFDAIVIKKIVCGPNHSMILSSDGQIFCFGDNTNGQIGNGSTDQQFIPFKIRDISKVKDIIANRENDLSVAVTEDNRIYVWGLAQNKKCLKPELIPPSKTSLFNVYAKYATNKVTFKAIEISEAIKKFVIDPTMASNEPEVTKTNEYIVESEPKTDPINTKIRDIISSFGSHVYGDEKPNEEPIEHELEDEEEYFEAEDDNLILQYDSEESREDNFNGNHDFGSSIGQSLSGASHEIGSNISSVSSDMTAGDIFLRRLRHSFDNPRHFDLKVIAGDQEIYCHKTVLEIRNLKFWTKLSEELNQEYIWSTNSEVTINPVLCPAFYAFLQFLYGIEPQIDRLFIDDLIKMAQVFEEPELEAYCHQLRENNITIDETNLCPLYERAVTEGSSDLEKSCVEFAANNWKNVCKSDAFQSLDDNLSKRLMKSVILFN